MRERTRGRKRTNTSSSLPGAIRPCRLPRESACLPRRRCCPPFISVRSTHASDLPSDHRLLLSLFKSEECVCASCKRDDCHTQGTL